MPVKVLLDRVTEHHIKRFVKKRLDAIGAYHHWPVMYGRGEACLDCHGCYKGIYFAIETKRPGEKMTPRQEITARAIKAAGGLVFVIDNEIAANNLFRKDSEPCPTSYRSQMPSP